MIIEIAIYNLKMWRKCTGKAHRHIHWLIDQELSRS